MLLLMELPRYYLLINYMPDQVAMSLVRPGRLLRHPKHHKADYAEQPNRKDVLHKVAVANFPATDLEGACRPVLRHLLLAVVAVAQGRIPSAHYFIAI